MPANKSLHRTPAAPSPLSSKLLGPTLIEVAKG